VPDKTGHATRQLTVKLTGARSNGYPTPLATYTVYVLAPRAADVLARMQRDAQPPVPTGEIPDWGEGTEALLRLTNVLASGEAPEGKREAKLFAPGTVARLEAYTRPKSDALTVKVPDRVERDKPFTVQVTLKNPTKHALDLKVGLAFPPISGTSEFAALGRETVATVQSEVHLTLGKRETRQVELRATPHAAGLLGIHVSAELDDAREDRATQALRRALDNGAFEVVEIVDPKPGVDPKPIVVGAR